MFTAFMTPNAKIHIMNIYAYNKTDVIKGNLSIWKIWQNKIINYKYYTQYKEILNRQMIRSLF